MTIRVDLRSAAGAALDVPPLVDNDVLGFVYGLTLGKIGTFTLTVAADSLAAGGLTIARQVWCYESTEGLIFKGIIEDVTNQVGSDGKEMLVVVGRSTAASLTWATTLLGRTFDNQTLSTVVSTLVSGTQFSSGDIDSPSTNITTRMDGRTIWESLVFVADVFGLSLREDNIDTKVDVGAFGSASGITFRNVAEHSQGLADNPYLYAIRSIKKRSYALDVANQIIPIAQQTGIAGSSVWFNLANSTRSSPYTIQSATGPDSQTYYYISDSTSVATYGTRQRVVQVRDILPLGTSTTDLQRAANTLYDEAVNFLQKHKDPLDEYDVEVVGLRHVANGAYRFQVGDTFRVQFTGNALDSSGGTTTALTVDTNLYLLGFTRTFNADGSDTWKLTLSNVLREVPNDGNITAQFMSQLQAVKAAPLPFVLFGDNVARISPNGLDLIGFTDSTIEGSSERKVSWYADSAWSDLIADMFGAAYNGGGLDNRNFNLRVIRDDFNQLRLGVWDNSTHDWHFVERITGESSFSGGGWTIEKEGTPLLYLAQTTPGDDSSWDLWIHNGGADKKVGGDMKATNDGAYFLPAGPERGQYYASDYTNWRPLSRSTVAPAAAPTTTISSSGLTAVNLPSSIATGDLLFVMCSSNVNAAHATPSGWTKAVEKTQVGGGFPHATAVFYKVAAGTESGTTPNFSAGVADCVAHAYRVPAGKYTGAVSASAGASGTTSGCNPDALALTGRFLVFAVGGYSNTTIGANSPYGNTTQTGTSNGGLECYIGTDYTCKDVVSSEDPAGFTGSVTTWEAMTVAVRAADNAVDADTTITNLIVSPAATPDYIQIELATGDPGSETSIGEHKIVPGDVNNFIPIDLSSGDRISARISGGAAYLSVQLLDTADQG